MGFYLNKSNLYRKMKITLVALFLAFVFVAQTSAQKCPVAQAKAVKECLLEDGRCKVACKTCVEAKCAKVAMGKPKARCAMNQCAKACECKLACFEKCDKM